jgi:hypothetical protein
MAKVETESARLSQRTETTHPLNDKFGREDPEFDGNESHASDTEQESHRIGPFTNDPEIFKLFEKRQTPKTETTVTFIANQTNSSNLKFLEEWNPISDRETVA